MLLRARRFALPRTDAFSTVQREMESLFGRVLGDCENGCSTSGWRAPIAVWDDANKVYLDLDVPGVSKESVEITVHNGVMRISGERKAPEGERNYWVNDRLYGSFNRTINLPEDVDADSVDARLTDGVLHIELSKKPEAQPKRIALKD